MSEQSPKMIEIRRIQEREDVSGRDQILDKEYEDLVEENGFLESICVNRVDNGYKVILGNDLLKIADESGKDQIPAIIKDVSKEKARELAIIGNKYRGYSEPDRSILSIDEFFDEYEREDLIRMFGEQTVELYENYGVGPKKEVGADGQDSGEDDRNPLDQGVKESEEPDPSEIKWDDRTQKLAYELVLQEMDGETPGERAFRMAMAATSKDKDQLMSNFLESDMEDE